MGCSSSNRLAWTHIIKRLHRRSDRAKSLRRNLSENGWERGFEQSHCINDFCKCS